MTNICAAKNCMQIATNHYKKPMCREHYRAWFTAPTGPEEALRIILEEETLDDLQIIELDELWVEA